MTDKKVWLIGLDGASFEILEPMFAAGKLPVLKSMMDNGASAILKSSVSPFTPQAWGSVITGNNAGKHGTFGFIRQMPGQAPEFLNSRTLKGDRIWTHLGRQGLESLVVNVPLTYPPEPLRGLMVTGMMTPSTNSEFTYPHELKNRVLSEWPDYKLDVTAGISNSRNLAILDELEAAMEIRVELTLKLIEERSPDFIFKAFVLPDRIQHTYCQLIHPRSTAYNSAKAKKWRGRIWDSYAKLDQAIGRLVEAASPDTDIIFASDHGFAVERGGFFTNDFLASIGMLGFKNGIGPGGGNSKALRELVRRFNMTAIKKFIPAKMIKQTIKMTKEAIDWEHTYAYASTIAQQGIYVNLKGREPHGTVEPGDYERVRDKIIAEVGRLKGLAGDEAPPARAIRREEAFNGDFIEIIPDIVLDFSAADLESKEALLGGDPIVWTGGGSRGIHHRDGLFIAAGPKVKPGWHDELILEDIAPNVLALMGVNGYQKMDGRVRNDIFQI